MSHDVVVREDAEQFAAQPDVLGAQSQLLQRALDHQLEIFHQGVGLDDVPVSSQIQRLDRGGHGGNGGDQDEGGRTVRLAGALQQIDAAQIRHANVGDDQIVSLAVDFFQGRLAARNRLHRVPVLAKGDLQHLAD